MADGGHHESRIVDWLAARGPAMEELLARIVNIDSPSGHVAGIDAVGGAIAAFLAGEGVRVEPLPTAGGAAILRAEVAAGEGAPVLLMGHMDTVFPRGTAAARPFSATAERLHGPGVADMKAGLVLNAFVLAAFARFGDRNLRGLFTIDEEIASPASRDVILDLAREGAPRAPPARRAPHAKKCTFWHVAVNSRQESPAVPNSRETRTPRRHATASRRCLPVSPWAC